MSLWNLIYRMLQFLMEQNKAIYHDCCFKHKVRGEVMQTPSQTGMMETICFSLGFLLTPTLGSSGHSQSDLLNHQPSYVTSEQAEKLFFLNWKNKWLYCILCGKFGSILCKYEKFMRFKWFMSSFKKTGIGVTENLLITHSTHCKVSSQ